MIPVGAKVRISARNQDGLERVHGQDVRVYLVSASGEETPIPGVVAVTWSVSARKRHARVGLVLLGVELDVEGEVDANATSAAAMAKNVAEAMSILAIEDPEEYP